ncbi:hypothetical protein LIER_10278 [Lithospermum erythrorhizon]|uniref:RING-type E3 ubiquitin transferase n=1 Tax=Lithospermum erythrorhizon TaxID=34254 RepID=A0AAV3PIU7_LITER
MSQTINLDDLFDLDMALEYPFDNTEEKNIETECCCDDIELPSGNGAIGVCSVCLEDYQPDEDKEEGGCSKQVQCGHIFHGNCIQVWLSHHNSCPLCRCIVYASSDST